MKTESTEIEINREYYVCKGNELIQKSRFDLSLTEQKTIAYICSKIKPAAPGEDYQLEYMFNIADYCKIVGVDYNAGKNYTDIKASLKRLADRSMWVVFENKPDEEVLCRWLSKVRSNKRSGQVVVELDSDLAPYLFKLGQRYTQYQLYNILAMKSAFSVRIYELLKSYQFQHFHIFKLDDLKKILMVESVKSYERFPDFRRKVLDISKREINNLTDINIEYEPITSGRKVVSLKFIIESKIGVDQVAATDNTYAILNHEK
jgi:plasmid replication initiation protein